MFPDAPNTEVEKETMCKVAYTKSNVRKTRMHQSRDKT